MSSTILGLLVEKWEAHLDELERIDETIAPPREAMDANDDADVSTLERLPKAILDVRARAVPGTSLMLCDAS